MKTPIAPTTQQLAILDSSDTYNLIYGNAGSAKTTTLALKVKDAIRQGLPPSVIQVLTYSAAAVRAFQERLSWMGVQKDVIRQIRVQTFNELCQAQLTTLEGMTACLNKANRQVYTTVLQAIDIARQHAQARGHGQDFAIQGDGSLLVSSLLHTFRRIKGTMSVQALGNGFVLTPTSAEEAGAEYTELAVLRAYERLRFDSVTRRSADGEEERKVERDSIGPRFRLDDDPLYDMACVLTADDPIYTADDHPLTLDIALLLVDEGHDLNRAMFTVLQHLIGRNPIGQVFVVGDVDQVVHSDGGADKAFMQDSFVRDIGPARTLHLETCWRFGEALAQPLGQHADKSYAAALGKSTRIEIGEVTDVKSVAALIDGAFRTAAKTSGGKAPSLAVILRHPGASVQLESALALRGYSTETFGFDPFSLRPEILFLRVLVAWATDSIATLAQADLALIQSALAEFTGCMSERRFRHVGYSKLSDFHSWFLGDFERFITQADTGQAASVINFSDSDALDILRRFLAPLRKIHPTELPRRVQDSNFVRMVKRALVFDEQVEEAMDSMLEFAHSAADFETFSAWLEQMANRDHDVRRGRVKSGQIVRLYAIPAAKGLEFEHVVIPDVSAERFDGFGQEERNLFYVATSRTREKLTMTFTGRASRFLSLFEQPQDWRVHD